MDPLFFALGTSLRSTMAVALPSTLFLSPSKPSSHSSSPHFSTLAAARPSPRISSARPAFRVRCQDASALVPEEQQWMFDEDVINGPDIFNKTWYPKAKDHINTEKTWYIVDATDKVLGRLASTIAIHIRGKNLATYTPSVDMGAYVIVCSALIKETKGEIIEMERWLSFDDGPMLFGNVNAEKVAVTGKKRTQKLYVRHSGRPGGMKVETFDHLQERIPERIIEHAVRGMLPKNRLGRRLFTHLKVYKGPDHPHQAQQPIDLPIRDKRIQLER